VKNIFKIKIKKSNHPHLKGEERDGYDSSCPYIKRRKCKCNETGDETGDGCLFHRYIINVMVEL